jgi:hypothetical protein
MLNHKYLISAFSTVGQWTSPSMVACGAVKAGLKSSSIFFTDGSKGKAGTGFGVHHPSGSESSFCLREPSGVFTSGIFVSLIQIGARHHGRYLIVTDIMGH